MSTVLIADGDAACRTRIRADLGGRGFSVSAEAANAKQAVELAIREAPALCLVDVRLPGNGFAAIAQIVKAVPTTAVVALAESTEAADVLAVLERGASGYLLKSLGPDDLAAALRAAANGEPALSRALVPLLVHQVRRGNPRRLALPSGSVSLTAREWDVGALLCEGHATNEIAQRLGVSPVTVRRHVGLLLKKLGAANRKTAVEMLRLHAR